MLEECGEWVKGFEATVTILIGCDFRNSFVIAVWHDSLYNLSVFGTGLKTQVCYDLPRFLEERRIPFAPGEHLDLGMHLIHLGR